MVSVYPPVGHHLVDSNNGTMITSPLITNVSSCLSLVGGFQCFCLPSSFQVFYSFVFLKTTINLFVGQVDHNGVYRRVH